ncbi:hypothetical protein [Pseudomonas sp. MWU12-2323]|uniref:hypothetical protein n=1 Tax=Pseudomonas sp. MWU12-2323 TaxID=2651296 RepID=UPI00128E52EE|nr:hypothetical protein [Pseudomonas sp. MWU12-2323]MPQ69441.1 hypothetical protein [Pseudomonas sp. MWU12-2323]
MRAIWAWGECGCQLIVLVQNDEAVVEQQLSYPELITLRLVRRIGVGGLMAKAFDLAGVEPAEAC